MTENDDNNTWQEINLCVLTIGQLFPKWYEQGYQHVHCHPSQLYQRLLSQAVSSESEKMK